MAEPVDLTRVERRDETPAQRYLRLARTDPELLDRLAANTWAHVRGLPHLHPADRWKDVPEEERQAWRERVLTDLEEESGAAPDPSSGESEPADTQAVYGPGQKSLRREVNPEALEAFRRAASASSEGTSEAAPRGNIHRVHYVRERLHRLGHTGKRGATQAACRKMADHLLVYLRDRATPPASPEPLESVTGCGRMVSEETVPPLTLYDEDPEPLDREGLRRAWEYEYVGGGYFWRKGTPTGQVAETLHGTQVVDHLFALLLPHLERERQRAEGAEREATQWMERAEALEQEVADLGGRLARAEAARAPDPEAPDA